MEFYSATRDIDCEPHYFKELDNALDYVWLPMFEKLSKDKNISIFDIDDLYTKYTTEHDDIYTLDAPESWEEFYRALGGIIVKCTFDDN